MKNKELLNKFYKGFQNGNAKEMTECYHSEIVFQDPVFGKLHGKEATKMWEMLIAKGKGNNKITFNSIQADKETGSANWIAEYNYGEKKRKVINNVSAKFKFKDGLIIEHTDTFDLWKWTKQALGAPGYVMGWTSFMKNKIQKTTNSQLSDFMKK